MSYKDKLSIRKVNYNFVMKVHLYYNENSKNEESDEFPMFYLVPVKLTNVEKVAFSKRASSKGYLKHGNRFWKYKYADELSNEQIEQYFTSIKNSYPYGFSVGDNVSKLKYNQDVKFNKSFQAFYKKYWFNNLDKVKQPEGYLSNENFVFKNHPFPYIEYTVNEVITVKFPKGQYNPIPSRSLYGEYNTSSSVYTQPVSVFCEEADLDVSVRKDLLLNEASELKIVPNLYLKNYPNQNLFLGRNKTYFFHLKSGSYWPTGSGGIFSGYQLCFSTGIEGIHNGFQEYTSGVQRFGSPSANTSFSVGVATKTSGHSYFSQGSVLGYCVDSTCNAPSLNLTRGNTYSFIQTGSFSSIDHPVYISTNPLGENKFIYSDGVIINTTSGERNVLFTVPYDSPNVLYYTCEDHSYMGGTINVINPPLSSGNLPGNVIKASFNVSGGSNSMYYYSKEVSGMGGKIYLSNFCP